MIYTCLKCWQSNLKEIFNYQNISNNFVNNFMSIKSKVDLYTINNFVKSKFKQND